MVEDASIVIIDRIEIGRLRPAAAVLDRDKAPKARVRIRFMGFLSVESCTEGGRYDRRNSFRTFIGWQVINRTHWRTNFVFATRRFLGL